jgi:hypothetical protein
LRERIAEANRLHENISKQNSFETGGVLQMQTPVYSVGSSVMISSPRVTSQSPDASISTTSSSSMPVVDSLANTDTRNISSKRARQEPEQCDHGVFVGVRSTCSTL